MSDQMKEDLEGKEAEPRFKPNVLVVDDTQINRDLVAALVAPMAGDLRTAENGRDALKKFESRENPDKFDVVITDLQMPEMDGLELARRIKEVRPQTKVILVSGTLAEEDANSPEWLSQRGLDAAFGKPFVAAKFRETFVRITSPAEEVA